MRARDLVKVGHFGQQVADFHIITSFQGQAVGRATEGIERAVGWSNDAAVVDFFLESGHGSAQLLDLQSGAIGIELNAVLELLLDGGELLRLSVGFGEIEIVGGEFIFVAACWATRRWRES